jgi:uncharacterized protein YndB with AHSA1/START domain
VTTTSVSVRISAPASAVYNAILDADAVAEWMVPDGMTSHVHAFEASEGGYFRISLTYDSPDAAGKTTEHTDTYHGRFIELVPDTKVVQMVEFETDDPNLQGEMRITYELVEAHGVTDVIGLHEGLPDGVAPSDNEEGWRMSLGKLKALLEAE